MSFFKNTIQKLFIFATDVDGAAKTGLAATITAQISKDGGTTYATNDTNPTELDATDAPGIYYFDTTAAETNCDCVILQAVSSTAGVTIRPVVIYTDLYRINAAVATDAGNSTTSFKTTLTSATDDFYNDAFLLITSGTLTGQVRMVTNYVGSSKIITCDAFTAIPADAVTFVLINQ
jgi:hypothetical protein